VARVQPKQRAVDPREQRRLIDDPSRPSRRSPFQLAALHAATLCETPCEHPLDISYSIRQCAILYEPRRS
jgi:hypothetical protein